MQEEIERLYRCYRNDIYGYLCGLTHDPQWAEDLLSETFLHALRGLRSYKGNANVKTWLCSIARNVWVDQLRRKKITLSYDDPLENCLHAVAAGTRTEESAAHRVQAERARALLHSRRPPAERVLLLRAQGYSFAEIAQKCGISESAARTLEFRTRKWLRERMEQEGWL